MFYFVGGICSLGKDLTSFPPLLMKKGLNQQLVIRNFDFSVLHLLFFLLTLDDL